MDALISKWSGCFYLILYFTSRLSYAHDWPIHQAISASAYQASGGLQIFINKNIKNDANALLTAHQPQIQCGFTVSNWLTMGSKMEDEQKYAQTLYLLTPRCCDHFYTVTPTRISGQAIGLTDNSDPFWKFGFLPSPITNSFVWASQTNIQGPAGIGANFYNWPCVNGSVLSIDTNECFAGERVSPRKVTIWFRNVSQAVRRWPPPVIGSQLACWCRASIRAPSAASSSISPHRRVWDCP